MPRTPPLTRARVTPFVIFVLGCLLALGVYEATAQWGAAVDDREFEAAAGRAEAADLDRAQQPLLGLRGLFAASTHVDPEEFHAYVEAVHSAPGAVAVAWAPWSADTFTFEYVEPSTARTALHEHLAASPDVLRAIRQAGDSGLPAAAQGTVPRESGASVALVVVVPVYQGGEIPEAREERRAALQGFVVGVFAVSELLEPSIIAARRDGLSVDLLDVSGAAEGTAGGIDAGGLPLLATAPSGTIRDGAVTRARAFEVADRRWMLRLVARSKFPSTRGWLPAATGLAALVVAGLAATLNATLAGRARHVEQEIRAQTSDLRALADSHRATAQTLSEREQRLQAILDTAADAIIGMSDRGVIESFNAAAERMFGYRTDEVVGRSIEVLMPASTASGHQHSVDRYVATGEATTVVGKVRSDRARRQDGSEFPIQLSVSEVIDNGGRSFTGIIRDMTQISQAEEQLREQARAAHDLVIRAEQATVAKADFLARMSHEIRTPMNGVLGATELLLGTDLDEEQNEYVTLARGSGEALLAIVNDILDFSAIEAGRVALEHVPFSLRDAVAGIVREASGREDATGNEFAIDCPDDVPARVYGDPERLRQVLLQFGRNAVKFTPSGKVVFRIEELDAPAQGAWTWLRFSVTDEGIGIASDQLERVFESFTQVESASSRTYGGTGLGLAIARQVAELMGGRVGATSLLGAGSTFFVDVPLRAAAEAPNSRLESALASSRILVIGRRDVGRIHLTQQLDSWGMEVSSASSLDEGASMLRTGLAGGHPFSLVIFDCDGAAEVDALLDGTASDFALGDARVVAVVGGIERPRPTDALAAAIGRPWRPSALMDALASAVVVSGEPDAIVVRGDGPRERAPRVLLVDNSPVNAAVARRMLERLSCTVDTAKGGAEAVSMVEATRYDLVLMDCAMPEVDGYEATARIRVGSHADVVIVAMTADVGPEDCARCVAVGMNDFLPKPVRAAALEETLGRWVPAAKVAA